MATEYDWLTLDDDETVVWSGQPHESSLAGALLVGLPLSLILIGIPIVVGAYLSVKNTDYVVTDAGLYKKTGVFSRDVQKIDFDKVQNISYSQGFFGQQFGYGNVDVSTAGGSGVEMQFRAVPDPKDVQEEINRQIKRTGRGGDGGDGPSKEAVLDEILRELRAIRTAVEESDGRSVGGDGSRRQPPADREDSP